MKVKKIIILVIIGIIIGLIYLYIFALGYGGGKSVKPVESKKIDQLEKQIKQDTQYDGSYIDKPRHYELKNCSGIMKQEINLHINNEKLKNNDSLKSYVNELNLKIQSIFPYDKKCYDSVVIQTQYHDNNADSTINKRFSFPMIK